MLDKILFDDFELALIKNKILKRRHVIWKNLYNTLFVPKPICQFCKKKIKKQQYVFIPNYGIIHTECLNNKRKETKC